jgi:hypothetical protein
MIRKLVIAMLVFSFGLSAKIWVNAIRDPGAELGQGDWKVLKQGRADSANVSAHDSSRAFEGKFSFLTDTHVDNRINGTYCSVKCFQTLKVPKAVKDIDSCFWVMYLNEGKESSKDLFDVYFRSRNRQIYWYGDIGDFARNDSVLPIKFSLPDSGVWTKYGFNFQNSWVDYTSWPITDTIDEAGFYSWGNRISIWQGQDASWDNIVLRSVAYYDYASKSIDSDVPSGGKYTPIVTFANEAIKADKDAYVYAEILEGSSKVYVDSQKVSIPKESSKQVTFKEWSVTGAGPFTLRVYPILDLDELSSDDTLEKSLGGVSEEPVTPPAKLFRFGVLSSAQDVEFSFSPNLSGELSVYDASGRKVFNRSITFGTTELHWSTTGIPSGLYFARLVSSGKTTTNKLLILN